MSDGQIAGTAVASPLPAPDRVPAGTRQAVPVRIGLLILMLFLLLRPVTVAYHHIGSVSLLDIFGVAVSYLIILGLFLNCNRLRIDFTSLAILFFVFYCGVSFAWGSNYRDAVRMVLPFLPFFLTRAVVLRQKSVTLLLQSATWGYVLPVTGSLVVIGLGISTTMVTGSMVERQAGLASGVHTQGHLMLFFSFIFALYCLLAPDKRKFKRFMFVLLLATLFCIFKTYTRTVILGGAIFWFGHLFFWKRKLFFLLLAVALAASVFLLQDIRNLVTQEHAVSNQGGINRKITLNTASSGRIGIWQHNLRLYADLPLTTQLLGVGLGRELDRIPGTADQQWIGSHNDYLSLLITTGVLGLLFYLMIYGTVFATLVFRPLERRLRVFGLALLAAVMVMNFVSNSYIVRFQMAQLFWFLIGLLYALAAQQRPPLKTGTRGVA